jgi:hypothetical protein
MVSPHLVPNAVLSQREYPFAQCSYSPDGTLSLRAIKV